MKNKTRAARRTASRRAERRHRDAAAFMPWYNKSWRALNRALQDKAILESELRLAEAEFLLREEESYAW